MMNNLITVQIVAFAESVAPKILSTATIAECASTGHFTTTTIAKVESINPTVRFARSFYLALEVPRTKCPVVTLFTGNASGSWQPTTRGARFAKRRPRPRNE